MRRKDSISALKKRAWRVFSLWIRSRGADGDYNTCITCGVVKPISELDAGHFISRRFQNTLFDERNSWPQCRKENRFQNGNWTAYYEFMRKKFGQETIDELIAESKKIKKWTAQELQEIIRKYRL